LRQSGLMVLLLSGCGSAGETNGAPADQSSEVLGDGAVAADGAGLPLDAEVRDDGGAGTSKGSVTLTYYWVASQADYSGANDTVLCDKKGGALATVPLAFAKALALEGTGRLLDGRLLNVAGSCSCSSGMSTCYMVLDPAKYPWGLGVAGRALQPFRSIAVDRTYIPIGSRVYVPSFEGLTMPSSYGFVHDGCLSADDVGGHIIGAHIDWFVAEKANYRALDAALRLSSVTAYVDPSRCSKPAAP